MTTENKLFVVGTEFLFVICDKTNVDLSSWLLLEQNMRWYKNSLSHAALPKLTSKFLLKLNFLNFIKNFVFFKAAPPNTKFSPNPQFIFSTVSLPIISLSSLPNSLPCLQPTFNQKDERSFFSWGYLKPGYLNSGCGETRATKFWRLIFLDPECKLCWMSFFWCLNFDVAF